MATGRENKLVGQVGEFLVCAELGLQGLIATPFSGNVPEFDVIATDSFCRTIPIQVKANRGGSWPSQANHWLDISVDEATSQQVWTKLQGVRNPTLIHVMVAMSASRMERDRFFVLTKQELQAAYIAGYRQWMDPREWKRPRKVNSLDNRISIENLRPFENRWGLISQSFWESPQVRHQNAVLDLSDRILARLTSPEVGRWKDFVIWPNDPPIITRPLEQAESHAG